MHMSMQDDLMRHIEGYLAGNGAFGRLAAKHVIGKGVLMSQHEELRAVRLINAHALI